MKSIAFFAYSTEEDLSYVLEFSGIDLAGRSFEVKIKDRASDTTRATLTNGDGLTITGSNIFEAAYAKAGMSGWPRGEYSADVVDVTGGAHSRIQAVRFVLDLPGRLVQGVRDRKAFVRWEPNQAVVTSTGAVGPAGPRGPTGNTGAPGADGTDGVDGLNGWVPELAVVSDSSRVVQQVVDWFGGTGTKPATGQYVGDTGFVTDIALAKDIRGPVGPGVGPSDFASQAEAEAGLINDKAMSPLRTKQAVKVQAEDADFTPSLPATYTRPIGGRMQEARSFLDWVSPTKHAAIKAHSLAGDLNDEFDAVAASGERNIRVPRGLYPVSLDGWTMVADTPGMNLVGESARDSIVANVQGTPVPARPIAIFRGEDQRIADLNIKVNTGTMLQPTMGGGQIGFGSGVLFMGARFRCERVMASDSYDNALAAAVYDIATGAQTDGAPADGIFYGCRTQRAGSGTQTMKPSPSGPVPAPQPFQAGGGINNLSGGRIRAISCIDEFSAQGFISDYAGGAHDVWIGCASYGARKNQVGEWASLDATPGGQGFYLGATSQIIACAVYDCEGDGLWADGYAQACDIDLLVKGAMQRSALIQGSSHLVRIRSRDASQRGSGLYDAIEVRGAAATGIDTYTHSTGIIVHAHTAGSLHRYGLNINESAYQVLGALAAGSHLNGVTGPVSVPSVERFSVGDFTQPGLSGLFRRGLSLFARSNKSYLVEPFGDYQGNGTLILSDLVDPDKRIAAGIDPVANAAIIQAVHAGTSVLPMLLNPTGGEVMVGQGTWVSPLRLGNNRLWVDSAGKLRIKNGVPSSETDGTIVGTQT